MWMSVNTIVRGFVGGDANNILPHDNDPIIISVHCDKWDIKRVLIDAGNSIDILFQDLLERFQLDPDDIQTFQGCLVEIFGEQVQVNDHINLETMFGLNEKVNTIMARYPRSRHLITIKHHCGASALNLLRATK